MSALFEDDQPKKKLDIADSAILKKLESVLNELADTVDREPFDPKISTSLRMLADIAEEQVRFDKYYEYGCMSCGDPIEEEEQAEKPNKKSDEFKIPTADDLAKWYNMKD